MFTSYKRGSKFNCKVLDYRVVSVQSGSASTVEMENEEMRKDLSVRSCSIARLMNAFVMEVCEDFDSFFTHGMNQTFLSKMCSRMMNITQNSQVCSIMRQHLCSPCQVFIKMWSQRHPLNRELSSSIFLLDLGQMGRQPY